MILLGINLPSNCDHQLYASLFKLKTKQSGALRFDKYKTPLRSPKRIIVPETQEAPQIRRIACR